MPKKPDRVSQVVQEIAEAQAVVFAKVLEPTIGVLMELLEHECPAVRVYAICLLLALMEENLAAIPLHLRAKVCSRLVRRWDDPDPRVCECAKANLNLFMEVAEACKAARQQQLSLN